jgi:hypothetical protein
VWRIVGDPNHLSRYWPKVERVEGSDGSGFTKVFMTKSGRAVRADFAVVEADPAGRTRRWAQLIADTPFERVLVSSEEVARVEPADGGAKVTLETRQKLRGLGKLGGFLAKRGAAGQLDEALDGLERLL